MSDKEVDGKRRAFLKLAAVSAPAAAVAAASGQGAEAADATPQGNGLRKTEHVKKYLETARF